MSSKRYLIDIIISSYKNIFTLYALICWDYLVSSLFIRLSSK